MHPEQPFPHPVGSMFQVHFQAGPDLLKPCCTAQILFKAGVHPEQPANTLDKEAFDAVWQHSVLLLQRGFTTGSILTVDPEEAAVLGAPCQQDLMMCVGQFGLSSLCKPTSHLWSPGANLLTDTAAGMCISRRTLLERDLAQMAQSLEACDCAGDPWKRRYIYNQATCGRCGSRAATWDMQAHCLVPKPAVCCLIAGQCC